jgi:outer membrane murein-binding lipoprotein Lpp
MSVTPMGGSVSTLRRARDTAWEAHKAARIERCKAEIADLTEPSDKTRKRHAAAVAEAARATRLFNQASRKLEEAKELRAAA